MKKLAAALLLLMLTGSPAAADPPQGGAAFWREARRPGYLRARALLRQALQQRAAQEQSEGRAVGRAMIENALARLEIAHRLAPDDPEILFELAEATSRWERTTRDGTVERRDAEARALFEQLRDLDAGFRTFVVGFELGVLRTRARDYEGAAAEYAHALESSALVEPGAIAQAQGNLAEVTMLAGDLERAVEHYEEAEDTLMSTSNGATHPASLSLARFGRAVALDRLGEHDGAVEVAAAAIQASPISVNILQSRDVFFEPPCELYWYEAIAHLALAEDARTEGSPGHRAEIAQLERAQRNFRRFLDEGGEETQWASIAAEHVERLEAHIGRLRESEVRAVTPRAAAPRPRPAHTGAAPDMSRPHTYR